VRRRGDLAIRELILVAVAAILSGIAGVAGQSGWAIGAGAVLVVLSAATVMAAR
jgi:hypothetical protein